MVYIHAFRYSKPAAYLLYYYKEKSQITKKLPACSTKLQYYDTTEEMKRVLPAIVHPSHAVMFVVEAPTSKLRVVLEMLEQAKSVVEALTTKEVCIVIPSGTRIDLLSAVANKAQLLWCVFCLNAFPSPL